MIQFSVKYFITSILIFSGILFQSCKNNELNYINYYQKVNSIDSIYRFENQPEIAVKEYKKLFEKYPPKNQDKLREYETYITLAEKNNIDFGGIKSLKKLIYLLAPYSVYGPPKEYYPLFSKYGMDSLDVKKEIVIWENSLNKVLVDSFTIAMDRDQQYRKNNDQMMMIKQDIKNAKLLKWTFQNYGYPSIYKIGFKGNNENNITMATLLLHMAESKDYEYLRDKLFEYVKSGDCPPSIYATMVDRYEAQTNKRILYGNYGIIDNVDSVKLDSNRKNIGLPSKKHNEQLTKDRYMFKNLLE